MSGAIDVVARAYSLHGTEPHWLYELASASAPLLPGSEGAVALSVRVLPDTVEIEHFGDAGRVGTEPVEKTFQLSDPRAFDRLYRSGIPASSLSETVFPLVPGTAEMFAATTGYRDSFGIVAYTGTGLIVSLSAPQREPLRMTSNERRRWTQIASHVGAALRLRRRLEPAHGEHFELEQPAVEAIFDGRGHAQHLTHGVSADAATALREAIARRQRSTQDRWSEAESLAAWTGLVRGRWSIVDQIDSDGRRFVVAIENAPSVRDPRGLTQHELRVADQAGHGLGNKQIAYALGLSASAVSNALGSVRRKLGLATRAALVQFFAPSGIRARLHALTLLADEGGARLAYADLGETALGAEVANALDDVTEAEADVALALVQGTTYRRIAEDRGVSERTVANQVQSIFRKLDVHSRAGLAALLLADAPAPRHHQRASAEP